MWGGWREQYGPWERGTSHRENRSWGREEEKGQGQETGTEGQAVRLRQDRKEAERGQSEVRSGGKGTEVESPLVPGKPGPQLRTCGQNCRRWSDTAFLSLSLPFLLSFLLGTGY